MSLTFSFGILSIKLMHLKLIGGTWYYFRRVPADCAPIDPWQFVKKSLRTKDKVEAARLAIKEDRRQEAEWSARLKASGITTDTRATTDEAVALLSALGLSPGGARKDMGGITQWEKLELHLEEHYGSALDRARYAGQDDPVISDEERRALAEEAVAKLLSPIHKKALDLLHSEDAPKVFLSAARDLSLASRTGNDFRKQVDVAVNAFLDLFGDLPLDLIERNHARQYRDALLAKGNKTATVRKRVNTLSRVIKKAIREHGLKCENQFAELEIAGEKQDATKRETFTDQELNTLASFCRNNPTERHLMLAMLINTGARLQEILGLRKSDVVLDDGVPHIVITDEARSLKTAASVRTVPLVGVSLWAAQEQQKARTSGQWFFPVYAGDDGIKANTADVTLNNYIRKATGNDDLTCHCLRHTMADRLREITVEEVVLHAIGGWGKRTVSRGYGKGFLVEKLAPIMRQLKGY